MIGSFSRSGFSTLTGPAPTAARLETPGPDAQVCTKAPLAGNRKRRAIGRAIRHPDHTTTRRGRRCTLEMLGHTMSGPTSRPAQRRPSQPSRLQNRPTPQSHDLECRRPLAGCLVFLLGFVAGFGLALSSTNLNCGANSVPAIGLPLLRPCVIMRCFSAEQNTTLCSGSSMLWLYTSTNILCWVGPPRGVVFLPGSTPPRSVFWSNRPP